MNLFDVYSLAHILHKFTQIELSLFLPRVGGQGGQPVPDSVKQKMEQTLAEAEMFFKVVQLEDCLGYVSLAKHQWNRMLLDISSASEIVHRLQADIIGALQSRQFLRVLDDRLNLIPHFKGNETYPGIMKVIGPLVMAAFPSATDDFMEAASCLAADCNTGGVFHLMRVAEVGLRALAADRNASFKNKPIDQQEWGTILGYLDGAIKALREAPSSNWKNPGIKDVQVRFYSEVVAELRSFNEAWRRHIAHARADGIYDHDYANSVFKHVTKFIQKLAEKISEARVTPEYWE
jgi:hypothetical protein